MKTIITEEWLCNQNACREGLEYCEKKKLFKEKGIKFDVFIRKLCRLKKWHYAFWVLKRELLGRGPVLRSKLYKYELYLINKLKKKRKAGYLIFILMHKCFWRDIPVKVRKQIIEYGIKLLKY
jgi:hypothetical protein